MAEDDRDEEGAAAGEILDGDPTDAEDNELPPWAQRIVVFVVVVLLLAFLGAVALAIIDSYPDSVPTKHDPSFIDTIFNSRPVIWAARVVLLASAVVLMFAGLYAVASVCVRMARKQWLRRAGPFESELAEVGVELEQEVAPLFEALEEVAQMNEDLERRLAESNEELEQTLQANDGLSEALRDAYERLEKQGG